MNMVYIQFVTNIIVELPTWGPLFVLLQEVLGKLLQPPSEESINDSIKRLHNIGALDTDEVTRRRRNGV